MSMPGEDTPKRRYTWKDLVSSSIGFVSMILQMVMAIFYFNHLGVVILAYIGFGLVFLFLMVGWMAGVEFRKKGGVPKGKSCVKTTILVDSGIYAVVRHPMYTSWVLLSLALVLISQHWLSAILCVIASALFYIDARREDKSLITKFGEDYKKYMARVPRMNILIGVTRMFRTRKGK